MEPFRRNSESKCLIMNGRDCGNILRRKKAMKEKWVQRKVHVKKNRVFSLGLLVLFCITGSVQAAQQPSRFQEVAGSGGTILRDTTTGLEWQRCPYAQIWTGSGCGGTSWRGTWHDAVMLRVPGGFRLPTIDELKSLAPYDRRDFPGDYWFWSSSSSVDNGANVWGMNFLSGKAGSISKNNANKVRFVRTGQ